MYVARVVTSKREKENCILNEANENQITCSEISLLYQFRIDKWELLFLCLGSKSKGGDPFVLNMLFPSNAEFSVQLFNCFNHSACQVQI